MSTNTQPKDIRTKAYVLRRTNYGEADRILNLITPDGKISAIAKSVRKEKSKLAGNIEMFCLLDINIHKGKSDFGVVTSSKMLKYHDKLVKDFVRMELAAMFLKKVDVASENLEQTELFSVLDQALTALNDGINAQIVETWFWFNFAKAIGEDVNLYFDNSGKKLEIEKHYCWNDIDSAFEENPAGIYDEKYIKVMRLMLTSKVALVAQIKDIEKFIAHTLIIAKSINKL